jgi:hypothetical protein
VQHATGAYERERVAFKRYDEDEPPAERPIDLWIPAFLWGSLPIALAVYLFTHTRVVTFDLPWRYWLLSVPFTFATVIGFGLVTFSLVRLLWLGRTWRRRRRGDAPDLPCEIALPGGRRVTVRSPAGVALLSYLVPYYLPLWWGVVNHQLWLAGRSHEEAGWTARLHRAGYPVASALAFSRLARGVVLPALASFALSCKRLQTLRREVGIAPSSRRAIAKAAAVVVLGGYVVIQLPMPSLGALVPGLPMFLPFDRAPGSGIAWAVVGVLTSTAVLGFAGAYFQARLNDVFRECGSVVPEGPGARSVRRSSARRGQLARIRARVRSWQWRQVVLPRQRR